MREVGGRTKIRDVDKQAERKASTRAGWARRDELDVVVAMLVRHHGLTPVQARGLVWGRPGLLQRLLKRGRPPKRHLIEMADLADRLELERPGVPIRWNLIHRAVEALNEPEEMRESGPLRGEPIIEPRDSESWQRAVRRIRNRLRQEAATIAQSGPLYSKRFEKDREAARLFAAAVDAFFAAEAGNENGVKAPWRGATRDVSEPRMATKKPRRIERDAESVKFVKTGTETRKPGQTVTEPRPPRKKRGALGAPVANPRRDFTVASAPRPGPTAAKQSGTMPPRGLHPASRASANMREE
jgi:hypothetical protein